MLSVPELLILIAPALNVEPIAVNPPRAEVPPIAPLNVIDPDAAFTVSERAVPSLLTVLAKETLLELVTV